jgi:hypothetical protein
MAASETGGVSKDLLVENFLKLVNAANKTTGDIKTPVINANVKLAKAIKEGREYTKVVPPIEQNQKQELVTTLHKVAENMKEISKITFSELSDVRLNDIRQRYHDLCGSLRFLENEASSPDLYHLYSDVLGAF